MPGHTYDPENVFAKILRDEIPSVRVHEDGEFIAIRDVNPAAPTHILVIPRGAAPVSPAALAEADAPWLGRMIVLATRIAREQGLAERGYRLVMNCGADGGQAVPHLHLHLLGGRPLGGLA
ncbi:MAG: histidine triad nucleotide-binding protein [Dehalococcoidia bacterium]|nr:histidine triad nucleotide-binding protein [Dehalococcoidia bacterium]